jgi:hypothetical protein
MKSRVLISLHEVLSSTQLSVTLAGLPGTLSGPPGGFRVMIESYDDASAFLTVNQAEELVKALSKGLRALVRCDRCKHPLSEHWLDPGSPLVTGQVPKSKEGGECAECVRLGGGQERGDCPSFVSKEAVPVLAPRFFSHTADPDELAVECVSHGFDVFVVQEDTTRPGYGHVVRERGTGAYFIREATSGAVYLVQPAEGA